jgi:uncharacterized protein YcbX
MTSTIRQTFIYPIKSLAGIACEMLELTDRGARGDRRWMLVDQSGRFISQREWPKLCLMRMQRADLGFEVVGVNGDRLCLPFALDSGSSRKVSIWSDVVSAIEADPQVNDFFSRAFDMTCSLVYMPDNSHRFADNTYAGELQLNSFSDAFPLLLIGTASLNELNGRLRSSGQSEIGWDRFRPNIVVATDEPHVEDSWAEFRLGDVQAKGVKLCSRCVMTTVDQTSGVAGKEPLKTLAQYRSMKNKIMFGQNVIAQVGTIRVGDTVSVKRVAFPPNAEF